MARPEKTGLDYFSFDCDFYDNLKVRKVMRACGPAAGSILSCLLCNIYRWKGYYIVWDQDLPFDIADKIGVSEGAVSEVINKALQVDFFDSEIFKNYQILTSYEIQKRYRSGTLKRKDVKIEAKYLITEVKNKVIDGRNPINGAESTQSKVKESKVKNRAKALVASGSDAEVSQRQLKKLYEEAIEKVKGEEKPVVWKAIKAFITDHSPDWPEPYVDAWNIFATTYKLSCVEQISDGRRKKFLTRIAESGFDFLRILERIKTSPHLKGDNSSNWKCTFDWILENDKNYLKILEGNYN